MSRAIPEVGVRLADRYRLETCAHSLDGVTVWYANDEMLARAVGIYVIPETHELAEPMVTAAQAAATLEDSRFVRVLDAFRRDGNVHVIFERLPNARTLSDVLAKDGPLEPTLAQALITEAAEGICAAHEVGLAHLRLSPDTVLVTGTGQLKIFGLCIEAARHGTSSANPARSDTRGLGRVLHAALTARWPEGEAFGLQAAPYENGAICTPRQVRAGVPDALDGVVDRLLNPHPRVGTPLLTPGQLAAELRRLRAPRRAPAAATNDTGPLGAVGAILAPSPSTDGGWHPSAATRGVQAAVGGMLIIGLGLLGWQIVRAIGPGSPSDPAPGNLPLAAIRITDVRDFDPPPGGDGAENANQTRFAVDAMERTTWQTVRYPTSTFGQLKDGVGLVLDLGSPQTVRRVKLVFNRTGHSAEVRAANATVTAAPSDFGSYLLVAPPREDAGESESISLPFATKTRFLLIWLTKLPKDPGGEFRGGISEVAVSG
ncbi:MAG: protein kinase family protein [Sporichthyaceae bacterium]